MNRYSLLYQDPHTRRTGTGLPSFLTRRNTATAHVTILLGLWNGAAFLSEQLESIAHQTHRHWALRIRDDNSDDAGPAIARTFAATMPGRDIRIFSGPRRGAARNFLSLLNEVPLVSDAIAFADQDDVWLPDKLTRALEHLSGLPDDMPGLYCGRTILTDETLRVTGHSPLFRRAPSFRNALVQSIAGGNTMVMNRAALTLLRRAAIYRGPIPAHDWWAYQVISGAGGAVLYDPEPQVLYRQHNQNLVGSNSGTRARLRRLGGLARGVLRDWNAQNIAALETVRTCLTAENQMVLDSFAELRSRPLLDRLLLMRETALERQTAMGTAALWAAAAVGRV